MTAATNVRKVLAKAGFSDGDCMGIGSY